LNYLNDVGVLCTLGTSKEDIVAALLTRGEHVPKPENLFSSQWGHQVGRIHQKLPPVPAFLSQFDCRNNRMAVAALEQIRPAIDDTMECYGANRIGVVMGTSTSGIAETEDAVRSLIMEGEYPEGYHAIRGALGGLGEFVAAYLEIGGPVSTVSTACSSSGNAVLSARRLLDLGLCDAVVVGGVDSLCKMTVQGFASLEATAFDYCKPLTAARDGINIGEGAAIFLMSRDVGAVRLIGVAGSSDAHHISAPHPEGDGAFQAMSHALRDGGLQATDIDYLNLHGTGTPHNDSMECMAVNRLFGDSTPCSSTKSMTGHALGAASALELSFCWLLLSCSDTWRLPPSLHLEERDPQLAPVLLTGLNTYKEHRPRMCMSNSFAFGGNNVSLVIGATDE
jgi:3-oxoacyl-[acyl-carrier-protein] synthase-1